MTRKSTDNNELLREQLPLLAKAIAQDIRASTYCYKPRRGGLSSCAQGWAGRFRQYHWGDAADPFTTMQEIEDIEIVLSEALDELVLGEVWTEERSRDVTDKVFTLFEWGRVLRGAGHNPPDIELIRKVMRTAANCRDIYEAPMDSAWTKLAAMATSRSKSHKGKRQVIFDSRVSISLLEAVDRAAEAGGALAGIAKELHRLGLGYVPGRGGNRVARANELARRGWTNRYRTWTAQFLASEIVCAVCEELNSDSVCYGQMPISTSTYAEWNIRGVEMVLFMDGY
jgi:hypothetical protein